VSDMSESVTETPPKEIMKYLERALVYGWKSGLERSDFPPWADAMYTIDEIDEFTDFFDRFGSEEDFIDFLSRLSGIDHDTFKEMWSELSEKQRAKVIDVAVHNIAIIGIRELLKWVAKKLSDKRRKKARAKVLQVAKDYLNGKEDKFSLIVDMADILWPTEEAQAESGYEYEDFLSAATLVELYVYNKDLKELVKKYLVERLENAE